MFNNSTTYVIAFYGGSRRHYSTTPIELFAKKHIEFLNTHPKHITDVCFVFNSSTNPSDAAAIELCNDFLTNNNNINGSVIVRENTAASYGAWNQYLSHADIQTEYVFLIEDDYLPTRKDFLDFFIQKSEEGVGYVAALYDRGHAAIANGLFKTSNVVQARIEHENVLHIIADVSYSGGSYYNQINFLKNIKGSIVDITDIAHTQFMDTKKQIMTYRDKSLPLIIKPIL